jgi:hypothetical protein
MDNKKVYIDGLLFSGENYINNFLLLNIMFNIKIEQEDFFKNYIYNTYSRYSTIIDFEIFNNKYINKNITFYNINSLEIKNNIEEVFSDNYNITFEISNIKETVDDIFISLKNINTIFLSEFLKVDTLFSNKLTTIIYSISHKTGFMRWDIKSTFLSNIHFYIENSDTDITFEDKYEFIKYSLMKIVFNNEYVLDSIDMSEEILEVVQIIEEFE